MRQPYTHFIKIEYAYAHKDSDAQMLAAACQTDFAAYVEACRLAHYLLDSSMRRTCNRACAYMGFAYQALTLGSYYGTLNNLDYGGHKLAAEINRRGTDALLAHNLLHLQLLLTGSGKSDTQSRTAYINTAEHTSVCFLHLFIPLLLL
jgi:hypothetical protein